MTLAEVMRELASMGRQSEDAAKACDAQRDAHVAEYEALCDAGLAVDTARLGELYEYVVNQPRQARRLRKEAEVFREAIRLLLV